MPAFLLWLDLRFSMTEAAGDSHFGGVYVVPAQSALLHVLSAADLFADLTEAASAASVLGRMMLMDELKDRIAARAEIHGGTGSSHQAIRLPEIYICADRLFGAMASICFCCATQRPSSPRLTDCLRQAIRPYPPNMQLMYLALTMP